jgi:hypothetical protein
VGLEGAEVIVIAMRTRTRELERGVRSGLMVVDWLDGGCGVGRWVAFFLCLYSASSAFVRR